MSKRARGILIDWFTDGETPTGSQFADLLESYHHKDDGKIIKSNEDLGSGKRRLTFNDDTSIIVIDYTFAQRIGSVATVLVTDYTFALADAHTTILFDNAGAINATIPEDAVINFPINTRLTVTQFGVGKITIKEGTNVSVITPESAVSKQQFSTLTIIKIDTNKWVCSGDLQPK